MAAHINTILLSGNQLLNSKSSFLHCVPKIFDFTCNTDRAENHKKNTTQILRNSILSSTFSKLNPWTRRHWNFFFSVLKYLGSFCVFTQVSSSTSVFQPPEDIKAGSRNWEFLDFRVLTALPSWSDGLRAVKTIGQTLTPITWQTQSLSNNPGNGDHHLIWKGVESKAQGHKGVQSPTGFTGASYSWTEPAASYTNMEFSSSMPSLWN